MEDQEYPAIRENVRFVGDVGPLFEALAKAQGEFSTIGKDSTAIVDGKDGKRGYTFDYAGLDVVLAAVRPALSRHGLALTQVFSGQGAELLTVLAFGGSRVEVSCELPSWGRIQELGSALTYLKRYQLLGLLGVAPSDDDDGNAADGNAAAIKPRDRSQAPVPKSQPAPVPGAVSVATKRRINDLSKAAGFTLEDLKDFANKHGFGALDLLTEEKGAGLAEALQATKQELNQ